MPETNLERYNARQAKRDELIAEILKEARKQAAQAIKSLACRIDQHGRCNGRGVLAGDKPADNECLCTCHDPEITYWVEWTAASDGAALVGMCSGHYGTAFEAIVDGFADGPGDVEWIREHNDVEQVDEARWDALDAVLFDWAELPTVRKAELRPRTGSEARDD